MNAIPEKIRFQFSSERENASRTFMSSFRETKTWSLARKKNFIDLFTAIEYTACLYHSVERRTGCACDVACSASSRGRCKGTSLSVLRSRIIKTVTQSYDSPTLRILYSSLVPSYLEHTSIICPPYRP